MRRTIYDMEDLTQEKINSPRTIDRLVADELLEMGFSYNHTGTHYLHDSIVYSTSLKLEDFKDVNSLCRRVSAMVREKYKIGADHYCGSVLASIMRAFDVGNINYLLETFKSSYDYDKMSVGKNTFIMTVRKKIMEALEAGQSYNATQLRLIIQGTVENITDVTLLQALCNIVVSMEGGVMI